MKKVTDDFEESLKVLVKQNKKLMEANRQLVYQFYYFKKESDLKTKKVLFLFYSLLVNAFPDTKQYFQRHFSNLINFYPNAPAQIIEENNGANGENYIMDSGDSQDDFINDLDLTPAQKRVKKIPNPRLLYQELESKTDSENNSSKKNIIHRMMQQLFHSENGHEQFVDTIIKDYLKNIEAKEQGTQRGNSELSSLCGLQMKQFNQPSFSKSIKNRQNNFSDDLDRQLNSYSRGNNNLVFDRNGTENYSQRFSSKYNDKYENPRSEYLDNLENQTHMKSENYENLLDSIEQKLTNFNFNDKKNNSKE
jgi:hypothetical protein